MCDFSNARTLPSDVASIHIGVCGGWDCELRPCPITIVKMYPTSRDDAHTDSGLECSQCRGVPVVIRRTSNTVSFKASRPISSLGQWTQAFDQMNIYASDALSPENGPRRAPPGGNDPPPHGPIDLKGRGHREGGFERFVGGQLNPEFSCGLIFPPYWRFRGLDGQDSAEFATTASSGEGHRPE